MFFTGGLSFHFARIPHYVNAFKSACTNQISGHLPPGYNSLRTTLLHKEKPNIKRLLNPIKDSWVLKGVSVCSDGWSYSQRRPVINILVFCEIGPMFLKVVNCEGEVKDNHFIDSLLTNSIREIGPQNVVQVITDNVANCKAVGLHVEAKFPHIFWTRCVVYTLNLALKNICSPSTHPKYDDVMEVCGWIPKVSSIIANNGFRRFPGVFLHTKTLRLVGKEKKCLERYFLNDVERRQVNVEYANFSMFLGDFRGSDSMNDRGFLTSDIWWGIHGSSIKTLQAIALKLLGQPCSSSCCELNWSTYNFIHSMRRNKIAPQRAEDLVFVHTNLRLLSRRTPSYNEGVSQLWDVGGDGYDSMEMENAGMLEISDFSLDEPQLDDV
ncbi:hypothetical protein Ddye_015712 [Dipteronia dyeriana]|uniref:DUF659 domain-containing protein n=1 Tax=Dipteronia dyeriana TaxID=168575 RepID=A0AAD9U628_9ROSI|nr:hypothetical protein Ddye_015712 [Dipteronia dyeriana]